MEDGTPAAGPRVPAARAVRIDHNLSHAGRIRPPGSESLVAEPNQ
jgi:hypothetical protein